MTGVEREAGTQSHLVITSPVGGDAINGGTHIAYLASKEPSNFLLKGHSCPLCRLQQVSGFQRIT